MGKSNKKANAEVAVAVPAVPVKNGKKGKRQPEAEVAAQPPPKKLKPSAKIPPKKKQETSSSEDDSESEEEVKVTASKKAMLTKKPLAKESSSEEDSSDEEPTVKPVVQGKKGQVLLAKNGSVGAVRNGKAESSDSSDSDSDEDKVKKPAQTKATGKINVAKGKPVDDSSEEESSDEEPVVKVSQLNKKVQSTVSQKKAPVPTKAPTKKEESSSDESDSEESEEEDKSSAKKKPLTKPASAKMESRSEEDTSEESHEEPKAKKLKAGNAQQPKAGMPKAIQTKKESSSDDESSEESEEDEKPNSKPKVQATKMVPAKFVKKDTSSSEEETSESDEEPKSKQVTKGLQPPKIVKEESSGEEEESSDESDDEPNNKQQTLKTVKKESSSEEEESSDESDGEPKIKQASAKVIKSQKPAKIVKKESSSEEEESSDESDDEPKNKKPIVKGSKQEEDSDEEMDDAEEEAGKTNKKFATPKAGKEQASNLRIECLSASKMLKTPVTPGSKTLFVGNLAFSVDRDTVIQFFEDAGEVADVRLAMNDDGSLKGFGHVEFANEEAAMKCYSFLPNCSCALLNNVWLLTRVLGFARPVGLFFRLQSYTEAQFPGHFILSHLSLEVDTKLAPIKREVFGRSEKHYEQILVMYLFFQALELNGQELSGRPVRLDLARERGTPGVKQDWKSRDGSFSSNGSQQGQKSSTAFVRGFDKNQEEDDIRSSLMEHFADCGEIDSVRIPKDYDSGYVKGFAYVEFKDSGALSKALELSGSELGNQQLSVEEAMASRSGSRDGGGRRGGRDRGGGRSNRGRGRGDRSGGRGTPRVNFSASGTKTTFGDDE
eukprot:Gb_32672 [translate_table: standard]